MSPSPLDVLTGLVEELCDVQPSPVMSPGTTLLGAGLEPDVVDDAVVVSWRLAGDPSAESIPATSARSWTAWVADDGHRYRVSVEGKLSAVTIRREPLGLDHRAYKRFLRDSRPAEVQVSAVEVSGCAITARIPASAFVDWLGGDVVTFVAETEFDTGGLIAEMQSQAVDVRSGRVLRPAR